MKAGQRRIENVYPAKETSNSTSESGRVRATDSYTWVVDHGHGRWSEAPIRREDASPHVLLPSPSTPSTPTAAFVWMLYPYAVLSCAARDPRKRPRPRGRSSSRWRSSSAAIEQPYRPSRRQWACQLPRASGRRPCLCKSVLSASDTLQHTNYLPVGQRSAKNFFPVAPTFQKGSVSACRRGTLLRMFAFVVAPTPGAQSRMIIRCLAA